MAATVIGLDVGTNAVRAVEIELGDAPQIQRMGQVGLPVGAVVDGEVADVAAVSFALRRLWSEVGFKKKAVRVGMSSARVIVRTIEMPRLPHEDLMSTIRLQLDDYVPLPPDETIFDVRAIDETDSSAKTQQFLLAATHHDAVEPLMMALAGADLTVAAVDVIPAALAVMFTWIDTDADDGVDVLLSVGAGTIVVVAARNGEALYSRTVTNVGGRRTTEGIAEALAIGEAEAERIKRVNADDDPITASTMLGSSPSIAVLVGEVRASLSFYAEQTPTRPVRRLVVTGGGSLLVGLTSALGDELGLEVTFADAFAHVHLGPNTGFDTCDLPYVAPYMAAAIGIALRAGRPKDRRIDLTPVAIGTSHRMTARRMLAGVGAVVLVGGGAAYYMSSRTAIADEQAALESAEVHLSDLQTQIAERPAADGSSPTSEGASPAAIAASAAAGDIDWVGVEKAISEGSTPLGVVVSSFQGSFVAPPESEVAPVVDPVVDPDAASSVEPVVDPGVDPALDSAGPASSAALGKLTLGATAPGLVAVADWLDSIAADPRFAEPWASGLTVITQADGSTSVAFTMDLILTGENLVGAPVTAGVAG